MTLWVAPRTGCKLGVKRERELPAEPISQMMDCIEGSFSTASFRIGDPRLDVGLTAILN